MLSSFKLSKDIFDEIKPKDAIIPYTENDLEELSEIFSDKDEYNSRHNSFLSLDSIDRD